MARLERRERWPFVIFLWLCAMLGGAIATTDYETRPGINADAPATWPKESLLTLDSQRPTLVVFLHPMCNCSRATLNELTQIISHAQNLLTTYVVMVLPEGAPEAWRDQAVSEKAANIPGVTVIEDVNGIQAKLFGSFTSGQTMLFTPEGELAFSGGITPMRGMTGDNAGRSAIVALAHSLTPEKLRTPVFGCSLLGEKHSRAS